MSWPVLFGIVLPHWQQELFPPESLKTLYIGAQLGVGLYMFLVGVEFRTDLFHAHVRSAAAVSLAGIVVPFALAAVLARWLLRIPALFSDRATWFEAFLFLGAAIAITAFPMLARIIYERGLTGPLWVRSRFRPEQSMMLSRGVFWRSYWRALEVGQ